MRRQRDYRLNIALASLAKRPVLWTPSQENRRENPSGHGVDLLAEAYQTWREVVLEQGTPVSSWPAEALMFRRTRRGLMDAIIARMSDAEAHAAFEAAAVSGLDAEVDLLPDSESVGLPVPEYDTRWRRVSDEVFAQYAPVAQRRPA